MFLENKPHFFGRRKGRVIRKTKTTLLETFLPALKITEQTAFDRNTLFGTPVREICLEIGFGNGEHLAGQAKTIRRPVTSAPRFFKTALPISLPFSPASK